LFIIENILIPSEYSEEYKTLSLLADFEEEKVNDIGDIINQKNRTI